MRYRTALFAALLIVACSLSARNALSAIVVIPSTGVAADGVTLAPQGEADPHWQISFADGPFSSAIIPQNAGMPPDWAADGPKSQWIGPVAAYNVIGLAPGLYLYKTSFVLPDNFVPGSARLTGQYGSFNELVEVFVNTINSLQGPLPPGGAFTQLQPLDNLVNLGALMPGGNTIQFLVNARSVAGPGENPFTIATGFRAQNLALTYNVVPEPSSSLFVLALAAGGIAITSWRRRHSKQT